MKKCIIAISCNIFVRKMKKWRDSASLILIAKCNKVGNYKILTMRRSLQSSFLPNIHVYPGGKLEEADCSQNWLKLYNNFGITENCFNKLKNVKNHVPLYNNEIKNTIPKHISLRICAIRETFEECGILLCKSANSDRNLWSSYFQEVDIQKWQERVHKDAFQFIKMCSTYNIYPDIWSLHEWSNWLTPASKKILFNTLFYLACIPKILPIFIEKTEVETAQWESPKEVLKMSENLEIFLPPPQFYEVSRIINFSIIDELLIFAIKRASNGLEYFLPYLLSTKTMEVTILPGDDLYTEGEKYNNIIMESIPKTNKMHRIYHFKKWKNNLCIQNYKNNVDHIYPMEFTSSETM